jgi:CDP-diacylglycerol--glycerol-3-phosphate 3-phosphatidyltransferase
MNVKKILQDTKLDKKLCDPNTLTLFRIAASPVIVLLLLSPNQFCNFLAALLFSCAAITDYLDGFFARRQGITSTFGKAMDPLADKLLVSTPLIMMTSHGWIPAWLVCVIIGRELAVTGLRNIIAAEGEDISASQLGKWKTGFQIGAIIPLLLHDTYFGISFHEIGFVLLWLALIFTIWSGIKYFITFKKLLTG